MAYLVGLPIGLCIFLSLLATEPDDAALPETIHGNYNGLYRRSHTSARWKWIAFPIGLHVWIDQHWHKTTGGWKEWGVPVEACLWIIEAAILGGRFLK